MRLWTNKSFVESGEEQWTYIFVSDQPRPIFCLSVSDAAKNLTIKSVVTNTIRLRFDRRSTPVRMQFALRQFADLRYDRRPTCCELLHFGLDK